MELAHDTLRNVYQQQQLNSDDNEGLPLSDLETQVEMARRHVADIEDKQARTLGENPQIQLVHKSVIDISVALQSASVI